MAQKKLIAARESVSTKPFPIPVKEMISRYEQLNAGVISNVLREFAMLNQSLPHYIKPLRPERTVAGLAFTVKSAPNVKITGERSFRPRMLAELPADTIVVWDTSDDTMATPWSGGMTATAAGLGVKGAVIDGGIRETHQILEKDFPVFYKHRIPSGSPGRCLITHYQIPINIGDVLVAPDDIVFGDIDGIVIIPRDIAYDVLVRVEGTIQTEKNSHLSGQGRTVRNQGSYFRNRRFAWKRCG